MPCEMQHAFTCQPTSVASHKFKHHHYRLQHLNETTYMKMYGPTMHCSSKTSDYIKCSKCPCLAITHALSLNHHNDQWLSCLSVNQTLPQDVDRPNPVALPRFCNQRDWSRIC